MATKVKGGVIAANALTKLAAQVDTDLKEGCGGLARDLGSNIAFKTGPEACEAAGKALADIKAKLGAKANIAMTVSEPQCSMSLGMMTDCASACDASVKGGKAEATCEGGEISGKCDGECTGACQAAAPASCSGSCEGACDASFSGSCGGTCDGKCDGKQAKGNCKGKCDGVCDAHASGQCGGKCDGSCKLDATAKCEGTCSGTCSVAFKEPQCSGKVVPPKMSAECKVGCEANASANLSCTPPRVRVTVEGGADAAAAAKYVTALQQNLPRIIKLATGMAPRLLGAVKDAQATLEGGLTAAKAAADGRATAAAHIGQCLIDVQANVKVAVDFQASASASGSTGGWRRVASSLFPGALPQGPGRDVGALGFASHGEAGVECNPWAELLLCSAMGHLDELRVEDEEAARSGARLARRQEQ